MNVRYRFNILCINNYFAFYYQIRPVSTFHLYFFKDNWNRFFCFYKSTSLPKPVSKAGLINNFQASLVQWIYEYRTPRQV